MPDRPDPDEPTVRVGPRVAYRGPAVGAGLLLSLVVGWGPLTDAVTGSGSYESALMRFVACVVVSVAGAAFVGAVLDQSPRADRSSSSGGSGRQGAP